MPEFPRHGNTDSIKQVNQYLKEPKNLKQVFTLIDFGLPKSDHFFENAGEHGLTEYKKDCLRSS